MKEAKNLQTNTFIKNKNEQNQSWAELYKTLQELLDRRQELLAQVQEFKQLDEVLKNYFSGIATCHIGSYKVTSREIEEESFHLPNHLRNKYLRRNKKLEVEISKI